MQELGLTIVEPGPASDCAPGLAPDSEAAILRRCRAGDWSDYGQLVERYQRLVWAAVDAVAPDKSAVPDLVQESFVRAFEKLHLYESRSSFSSWLYRLARNIALSAGRSAARRPVQLMGEPRELELGAPPPRRMDGPAEAYLDSARGRALRALLAELPEQYHEPLALYYFHDLSYGQIAQALGLPLNTVRTHLRRARLRLLELARGQGWAEGGVGDE
jgi:RNA polymerase sigma-70 factor (ECF subfamily)